MWTYYFLHSGTNQLIKGVTVCPQAYCNMGSAFMAIVTQAHSIEMKQLSSPYKKIRFLCDALLPFWKKLKYSWARIQAVAIDMSPAYVSAISKNLPKATIVFDHFHLIKLSNEKLSDFRRDLHHQATKEGKKVLKGLHRLLLKNPGNLKPQHNEKQRLEQPLLLNSSLATAYYLKEDLRQLWFQKNKKQASVHLDDWIARAKSSGIKMLLTFSETLEKHRDGILTYFDLPISTRPLEGTNNKIKTLQKQTYGFRDMSFFKLKIHGLH
jgi:transposase